MPSYSCLEGIPLLKTSNMLLSLARPSTQFQQTIEKEAFGRVNSDVGPHKYNWFFMNIPAYLNEIQHAVTTVIAEIHVETAHLDLLRQALAKLTAATEDAYRRVDFLAMNPDLDDDFLGTAIYWDTYFGVDKDRFHKNVETETAAQQVTAHEFSISALAGSLLQYGKQGISLHFGKNRVGCPDGRVVVGMPLHEIIWQARNQALHWEEGAFHAPTATCFEKLAANASPVFGQYKYRSLAYEIISLLGWKSPNEFRQDMLLFGV